MQHDTFFVTDTAEGISTVVKTGGGFDTVHVGTREEAEQIAFLDGIRGDLTIEGNGPEAEDSLFVNDQSSSGGKTYIVDNRPNVSSIQLENGKQLPIDETTIRRVNALGESIGGTIRYRTIEAVELQGGAGNDVFEIRNTHREQAAKGKNATFTISAGAGDDEILVGEQGENGFSLAKFAIDLADPPESNSGIPLIVDGQAGNDRVHYRDSARTESTEVGFVEREFGDLFPGTKLSGDDILTVNLSGSRLNSMEAPTAVEIKIQRAEISSDSPVTASLRVENTRSVMISRARDRCRSTVRTTNLLLRASNLWSFMGSLTSRSTPETSRPCWSSTPWT